MNTTPCNIAFENSHGQIICTYCPVNGDHLYLLSMVMRPNDIREIVLRGKVRELRADPNATVFVSEHGCFEFEYFRDRDAWLQSFADNTHVYGYAYLLTKNNRIIYSPVWKSTKAGCPPLRSLRI